MQVKALSCSEEALCEHDPETLLSPLGQSLFKMYRGKVENTDTMFPRLKRSSSLLSVLSTRFHLLWYVSLHIRKGTMHACSHPDDFFFRECLSFFSKTMPNCLLHLLQQHGFIGAESWCWTVLSAVQTSHQMRTFVASWNLKRRTENSVLLSC